LGAARLSGAYRVRLEVRATATAQDKQRVAAERLLAEANELSKQRSAAAQLTLEKSQQALVLWRALCGQYWGVYTLNLLGVAYKELSRYEKAIEYYEQALPIRRELKDLVGEGSTLGNLGNAYRLLSRYE